MELPQGKTASNFLNPDDLFEVGRFCFGHKTELKSATVGSHEKKEQKHTRKFFARFQTVDEADPTKVCGCLGCVSCAYSALTTWLGLVCSSAVLVGCATDEP